MKRRLCACVLAAVVALGSSASMARRQDGQNAGLARYPRNQAELDEMFKQVSNWGRWGKDDRRGTLNLVTDAKRKQAARLVKTGIAVSLSNNYPAEKAADNPNPFESLEGGTRFAFQIHTTALSHVDTLCNTAYMGRLYNGHLRDDVRRASGCTHMGLEILKDGVTTRGILIDMPRLKGVPFLEPGTPVFPEDVEAWEKKAGVRVSAGDAVFLYTGRWARRQKLGPWCMVGGACLAKEMPPGSGEAGWHVSIVPWFKKRDVAMVGADVSNDVVPTLVDVAGVPLPVHALTIAALGTPIFDAQDLETLAATAARLKRWEFMLTGAPLPVPGGTGSPINLVALF